MKPLNSVALIGALGLILGLFMAPQPAAAGERWLGTDHRVEHRYWRDHDRRDRGHWRRHDRWDGPVYRRYTYPRTYSYRYYDYRPHRYYDWDDDLSGFIRFGLTIPIYVD